MWSYIQLHNNNNNDNDNNRFCIAPLGRNFGGANVIKTAVNKDGHTKSFSTGKT